MNQTLPYKAAIGELQFLPSVHYISLLTQFTHVVIEQQENYNKGSFRNKCYVSSNRNSQYIIVPLKKGKHRSQHIQEVQISYDEDWIKILEHRLQTEYGSYPYFEYYNQDILKIVKKQWRFLYDLNRKLLEYFFQLIDFDNYTYSDRYNHQYPNEVIDLRDSITPSGFKSNPDMLTNVRIGYFNFVPGHSFIEALFAYGPEVSLLIRKYGEVVSQRKAMFVTERKDNP